MLIHAGVWLLPMPEVVSMPKDNIRGAIKKGEDKDGAHIEEMTYEGYAPHGIAIFFECSTDNQARTIANMRAIF